MFQFFTVLPICRHQARNTPGSVHSDVYTKPANCPVGRCLEHVEVMPTWLDTVSSSLTEVCASTETTGYGDGQDD